MCHEWQLNAVHSYVPDVQVAQTAGYTPFIPLPQHSLLQPNIQTLTQQRTAGLLRPAFFQNNNQSLALNPNNSPMHPMLPSQGQYSQFPAFTHNSFHLGFHRNSQGLNIQQPNYSLYPVDQPPLLYQSFTSSQSMMMSDLTSYQRNSSFSHGPSPSQTYPVSYGGGSSSSDMSGFLPLNQQTAYNETVTPGDSSMSAFIPEASAGQLQASSESRTDESSRSSESAYIGYKILC